MSGCILGKSSLVGCGDTGEGRGGLKNVGQDQDAVENLGAQLTHLQLYRDGKRVLECLQRALRVADACMDTAVSVELFVEILNRYVYYFDQQNETVSLPSPFSVRPMAY